MKGILEKQDQQWYIRFEEKELKVYPTDVYSFESWGIKEGDEVYFEIIDENTHPILYSMEVAKKGDIYAGINVNSLQWKEIFAEYKRTYRNYFLSLEDYLMEYYKAPHYCDE
jgi:hypothetical protein